MSTLLAAIPQRLGGLGYHHAAASAYPRLLTQTARAISLATSKQTPIPAPHRRWFNNWQHSEDPRLTQFRRGLALLTKELADEAIVAPDRFDRTTHHRQTNHILKEHVIGTLFDITPAEHTAMLPSLLSPITSTALHMPRPATEFRLDNPVFRTAIRRKLRIPLLPPNAINTTTTTTCRCPARRKLDPEGDHLFHCTAASKTALSNAIRDTLYTVLRHTAPKAKTVDGPHDVHVEPPGLAPEHNRNIRPADVGLKLSQPHSNDPFHYMAIDITVPPPQQRDPTLAPSDHQAIAQAASRTHQEAARSKFCWDVETAAHLHRNGVYLLPFTVDHLGSLGSFAQNLLFHPTATHIHSPPPSLRHGPTLTSVNRHPAAPPMPPHMLCTNNFPMLRNTSSTESTTTTSSDTPKPTFSPSRNSPGHPCRMRSSPPWPFTPINKSVPSRNTHPNNAPDPHN